MLRMFMLLILLPLFLPAQQFSRVQNSPVVSDGGDSRAVNWIDYDNDGDLDLFITNGPSSGQNNFFYVNNGDGSFSKADDLAITQDGTPSDGSSWGDFNNDGHPDLFVANWYNIDNLLYISNGDGTFTLLDDTSGNDRGYSESASWADTDGDAFIDLYVANSSGNLNNFVYKNSTMEKFSRLSGMPVTQDGGSSRHMNFADYDGDGHLDLFVPNENNENNFLYHNNGDGTFTAVTDGAIVNRPSSSFGSSWGDYDNDGDLDLFVANFDNQDNFLYRNNGDGTFETVTDGIVVKDGGYSIGSAWADVDNDGDLDLFVANGFSPAATTNFLYLNNGDGTFEKDTSNVSKESGWSYGASFGDFNRDGALDLAIARCLNASQNNALWLNNGNGNAWLTVKLEGTVSNRSAIGAVIRVKATINGENIWQMRQVSSQEGYCGQNPESHFGLGDAESVDSLVVQWPSGESEVFTHVSTKQLLTIKESVPEGFLRPHFKAGRRFGFVGDLIQFSDLSITAETEPIISRSWDFNNDGTPESDIENPAWSYDAPGIYSIKLTVSNSAIEKSVVFDDYIEVLSVPGVPLINSFQPAQTDTTILKRQSIDFNVDAQDTTGYELSYLWTLNGDSKSTDASYAYRALPAPTPRFDTVRVEISNGFNTSSMQWRVEVVDDISSLGDVDGQPRRFELRQNYPNPFNPSTEIGFSLPQRERVSLVVYDVSGKKVATLLSETLNSGEHKLRWDASGFPSGVYFYELRAGHMRQTRKMILIR